MLGPAVADYPTAARMAARVIDDCEFVWMLRGWARFTTEQEQISLSPGQLLLVPPGLRHSFAWDDERPSRHAYVHFQPREVGGAPVTQATLRRMTDRDPLGQLCAYLLWLGQERPDGWPGRADEVLRLLLALVTVGPLPADDGGARLPDSLRPAIDHLRRAWSRMPLRRVTVDELAAAASVSRSYFSRMFRAEFEMSPAAALERLRCARAETLLARTTMTVSAIARQSGYADLYHFSHRFARLHGLSPSAFRDTRSTASVLDHPGVRHLAYAVWD